MEFVTPTISLMEFPFYALWGDNYKGLRVDNCKGLWTVSPDVQQHTELELQRTTTTVNATSLNGTTAPPSTSAT